MKGWWSCASTSCSLAMALAAPPHAGETFKARRSGGRGETGGDAQSPPAAPPPSLPSTAAAPSSERPVVPGGEVELARNEEHGALSAAQARARRIAGAEPPVRRPAGPAADGQRGCGCGFDCGCGCAVQGNDDDVRCRRCGGGSSACCSGCCSHSSSDSCSGRRRSSSSGGGGGGGGGTGPTGCHGDTSPSIELFESDSAIEEPLVLLLGGSQWSVSASSATSQTVPQEPVPSTFMNDAIVTSSEVGTICIIALRVLRARAAARPSRVTRAREGRRRTSCFLWRDLL